MTWMSKYLSRMAPFGSPIRLNFELTEITAFNYLKKNDVIFICLSIRFLKNSLRSLLTLKGFVE